MIAALYVRKSTDQAVADEAKSVTRQIEHGRAYAARKGWAVDEAHIYVDDGISGAEFANRPGFVRLMNALKPKPPFQVLILSELSRLGREQLEVGYGCKLLSQAGVQIHSYLEDREITLDSPMDKFMLAAMNFGAEMERDKGRQRGWDTAAQHARAGHVTGGRVYGYDNVTVHDEHGQRAHVERRINDAEAAIVRRIFDLCATGSGYTRIAKLLNAERAVSPRPQRARPCGWAPSSVREILHRELYRGVVVWNRTKKRDRWGQQRQHDRPDSEWMRRPAPELRIVGDDVWQAAHARVRGIREHLATVSGVAAGARRHLLAGFARCSICRGGMCAVSRSHGKQRVFFYGCMAHHKRGAAVCPNSLIVAVDRVNDAVLRTIGGDVLRPAVVNAVIAGVLDAQRPEVFAHDLEQRRRELAELDAEIARLTDAVAAGGRLPGLLAGLQAREQRRNDMNSQIAALAATAPFHADRRAIQRHVREQVAAWRALLTTEINDGRELLRQVLAGPLRFTPAADKSYQFEGEAAIGRMLAGALGSATILASPAGFANGCNVKILGNVA